MFLYLDESGDLGFDFSKEKTSQYFVITILSCPNLPTLRVVQRAVKRTMRNKILKSKKQVQLAELKGAKTLLSTKKYFLKQLSDNLNWRLYSIVLNKKVLLDEITSTASTDRLYNFLAGKLIRTLELPAELERIDLFVDRSKTQKEILLFNSHLETQLESVLPLNTKLCIEHLPSEKDSGLQAVDLFCWGIYKKYESENTDWYDLYRDRVIKENVINKKDGS